MAASASSAYPRRMAVDPSERPLRIAVVSSRFPLPMTRADQMTVAHLLAFLSARGHRVDLYSLSDDEPTAEQQRWVAERCHGVFTFAQPRWRRLVGTLLGLAQGQPLQVGWFANAHQRRALQRQALAGRYDILYGYTLRCAQPLRRLGRSKRNGNAGPATYLAMQVSQSLNTARIAKHAPGRAERLLYRLEHRLVAAFEARIWQAFTRTVLIGEADARAVGEVCAAARQPAIDNYLLAPHGVDAERFRPREDGSADPFAVVFCGVMATNTNVGAVLWFVGEVWPEVRRAVPQARFKIVGRLPRREIRALDGQDGISVTGEVDDPADAIANAAVCVNPMQAGAGMQNKLLEYLAMAKPVVATSIANEGIGADPGTDLVIADDAADFAAAVVALLHDEKKRQRLGRAAREYVLRDWTWEKHFLNLEADMGEQVRGNASPLPSDRPH